MTFKAKLSPTKVLELHADYANGYSVDELMIIYRVSRRTIYRHIANFKGVRKEPIKLPTGVHRKKKHANQYSAQKDLKPCGTNAAYERHRDNGEIACGPCLTAHARDVKKAKKRKKKRNAKPSSTS